MADPAMLSALLNRFGDQYNPDKGPANPIRDMLQGPQASEPGGIQGHQTSEPVQPVAMNPGILAFLLKNPRMAQMLGYTPHDLMLMGQQGRPHGFVSGNQMDTPAIDTHGAGGGGAMPYPRGN